MKLKNLLKSSALVAPVALIAGCATLFTGTTQNLHVQAIDSRNNQAIPGAVCTIRDDKGHTYALSSNPGVVNISKGQGRLTVQCQRPGYHQTQVGVGQNFNAWTVVNVLFWPGIIVDVATGAVQKYPSHVTVIMAPNGKK